MSPRARRQQGRLGARSWPPRAHKFPVTFNLGKESTGVLKSVKVELLGYYKKALRAQKQRTPNQFRWVCDHVREFDLSFYIPIDVMNMPGHKIRHVVIMVNGLNEIAHLHYGHYDRIGAALAVRGMGAILCPSPFHLNRTPYFDARFQKNYERYRNAHRPDCYANLDYDRLKECRREPGADTVSRTPHKSMLRRNDCIFYFSEQTANELVMLCKFLRKIPVPPGLFDHDDEAFYDRFFARGEGFSVSLLGYSLGGLQALYAFLREPTLFNRCILLNSGASINKLSPNPVGIGDDEWDAIKNSAYSVNIRKSIGNWEILEDVLLHRPFDTTAAKNSFIHNHNSERLLFVAGGADLVSSSELLAQFVQHDQGGFGGLNLLQIAGWDHPLRNSPVYDHWFPVIMDLIENFLAHPDGKTVSFDQVVSGLLEFEIKGQQWDRWVIKRRRWYISPDDQNVRLKAFVHLVSHPQGHDDFLSLYMASKRYFQSDAELMRYLQGRREE